MTMRSLLTYFQQDMKDAIKEFQSTIKSREDDITRLRQGRDMLAAEMLEIRAKEKERGVPESNGQFQAHASSQAVSYVLLVTA